MALSTAPSQLGRSAAFVIERLTKRLWADIALGGICAIAAFLRLYHLNRNGFGNEYYAAGVKSMLTSWHDFFFVSFDPAGFVSLDKPPLGFWIQAGFAKTFGFSGMTVLLPQALAGTIAVVVLYAIVRRAFSRPAALLSAFALAAMPVSVAVDRDNSLEPLLVLTLLLAAWSCLLATDKGKIGWSVLTGLLLGLAFEIKLLQALIVLPVFVAVFLLGSRLDWRPKTEHLFLAAVVLAVVGLAWPVAVDLTPKDERPYVGSSADNTAFDLITGYNGLGRLSGEDNNVVRIGGPGGPAINASMFDGGEPGPFRLFEPRLAAQVMWLLPLGAIGVLAAWRGRNITRPSPQQQQLVLWTGWVGLHIVVFSSQKGIFHGYYVAQIAPAVAALAGIGLSALWQRYRERGWPASLLLPAALLATAALELYILNDFKSWNGWLLPLTAAGCIAAAATLALLRLRPGIGRLALTATAAGAIAVTAAPTAWSITPLLRPVNGLLPAAGPTQLVDLRASPLGAGGLPRFVPHFEENRNGATYLVAVPNALAAAPLILETGEPVMAMGGFSGFDPILTPEKLAKLTSENDLRFVLAGIGLSEEIAVWLQANCAPVTIPLAPDDPPLFGQLLDCAPAGVTG